MKSKLSVVLAVKNEEKNLKACLDSVKSIADEMIVVDDASTDGTKELAEELGAKVFSFSGKNNFHEVKQFAIEKAKNTWILQLDADEVVSSKLAGEISKVITMSDEEILQRRPNKKKNWNLFLRHQSLIKEREGKLGKSTGEVAAFFVPRRNIFLGKPIKYAGVYPDAVIRLFRRGKARLPAKNVHEVMEVDGEVAWLFNDLEHHDSPTFQRYLMRMNRYTDLAAKDMKKNDIKRSFANLVFYSFVKPLVVFMKLYFRHKGFLDGFRGFVWSLFSALRFPISYFKYWSGE